MIKDDGVNCPLSHPYCVSDTDVDYCSDDAQKAAEGCSESPILTNGDFFCTSEGYFPGTNVAEYSLIVFNFKYRYLEKLIT